MTGSSRPSGSYSLSMTNETVRFVTEPSCSGDDTLMIKVSSADIQLIPSVDVQSSRLIGTEQFELHASGKQVGELLLHLPNSSLARPKFDFREDDVVIGAGKDVVNIT